MGICTGGNFWDKIVVCYKWVNIGMLPIFFVSVIMYIFGWIAKQLGLKEWCCQSVRLPDLNILDNLV